MNHSKRLKDIKGLSEAKIDKMLEMSFKLCNVCSFKTAADIVSKVHCAHHVAQRENLYRQRTVLVTVANCLRCFVSLMSHHAAGNHYSRHDGFEGA